MLDFCWLLSSGLSRIYASYEYDDLYRLTEVIDPFTATVGYGYDKVGNRTNLIYPDQRVVTYTYYLDNRLETVLDWASGTTTYDYDLAGRLITTTLPNGVVSVNTFDDANRLTNLSHTSSNDVLIANFAYELDKVGNRTTVTETIRQPGALAGVTAFLEENGQLVLEAESGTASAGTTHTWNSQTAQSDYAGSAYMRALPDIGQQYDANATADSPGLNFTVQVDNPGSYTVWARGMAPDAAGDSLHVGVNDSAPTTAANVTGFAPNAWTWSRLTMSNTNATVDLSSSGTYTLNVWMAEDGLRLDKLLLVTDTATIPTGQGPLESPTTTALPNLGSHTIAYDYDDLYRLTDATYTGDITDTYEYEYNAVGNRTTYTATITTTTVTTYTYNAANQLVTAKEVGSPDIWHYVYDDNGNLVRQVPNGLTPADGEVRYTFNQRNLLVQIENHDGSSYLPQAEMKYDGAGNRLQSVSFILATAMTTTFTLDGLNNNLPLALDNGLETRNILYGLFGLGEFSTEWTYFLGDGQFSVRQLMDSNGNIALMRTYGPFGRVLQEAGDGSAIFGFAGAQSGGSGLLYINGRYYDPATGRFLSPDNNVDPMRPGTLNGYLSAIFLFGPFGAVIWRKRKKRNGRYDLMLFLVLGIGLGMLLVSCGEDDNSSGSSGTPVDFFGTDTPIVPGEPPALAPTSSSTPASPTGTPTSTTTPTPNNPATPTPNNPATPTPAPCPTPTPLPDTSGWTTRGKQAYYSLHYITNAEFTSQPWWGEEPEPKELAAWILQAEGSVILDDGKRFMAEGIRYRFDHSTCGIDCPSLVAWLSGFTPFFLISEANVAAVEAGTPLEQVICIPCLNRLLTEPEDQYKQLMYPLFENSPQYVLIGSPAAVYWWSKEDPFTAPIEEYEKQGVFTSCRYRARYRLVTGSFIWFGTQTQINHAIFGGVLPSECGS